ARYQPRSRTGTAARLEPPNPKRRSSTSLSESAASSAWMCRAVPARVSASGETSKPTRKRGAIVAPVCQSAFVARQHRLAAGAPREAGGVGEAALPQLGRPHQRLLERLREGLRVIRIGPPRRVAA